MLGCGMRRGAAEGAQCCPAGAGRGSWRSTARAPRSAPAAAVTAQEEREEGGLRPHLLPSPSLRHIPQRAELVSRVEGQKILKLKAQAFPTFFSIQVLQLLWGCGELL